ncbi:MULTISPECIES: fumarylacetoacetate hydrolase family protein [unclassified Marinobacter]|jgi:2-keto-4-pentenoate hydratase/2-oxohepta-3-ene-1,7-dioic acid hydratase in catechol pathway|uniref:fumarylacetoacetate hydrolase family protein n=1 Tax=unclassified Marinobacter TaxID=83889 RepID=UPI00200D8EBF|nr:MULTISPECIES: fumarylacetoacetate hydrolase family protein [unclassified Marinobacter]UQG55153.1 fumarylacetoacetate hydrolase family protein [Marinobacter sp. M4C]UQG63955.1 fumarylacetoacetate hydrolase family protein [Marinobacter sp. M2C]UQG68238.1 fumarylacetoacetate hydrolase family protein [Marinobacter sp. M1C]
MYVRYIYNNQTHYGHLAKGVITRLEGNMFDSIEPSDETISASAVKLLAPCEPSKVVCVGLNYLDHAKEMDLELPKAPLLFLKPPTTVIAHQNEIKAPGNVGRLDYEGELAIVIGKQAKNVSVEDAANVIFGFTCANDFTARDIQFSDQQWTRGKSFDTFCPLGPGIVREINQDDAKIQLTVNGEVKQSSNIKMFIFKVNEVVSYISQYMTLMPGDVILTGTPHGVGPVKSGDEMSVTIDGIGTLTNTLTIE